MLRLRNHIEELFVNSLSLASCIIPLDPIMFPVGINFFTGYIHLTVLHCEKCSVPSETNIQPRMESGGQLCRKNGTRRNIMSILNTPTTVFRTCMAFRISRTTSRLFTCKSNCQKLLIYYSLTDTFITIM